MLDGRERDRLTELAQYAQISAVHRALDEAWLLGYQAGIKDGNHPQQLSLDSMVKGG